MLTGTVRNCHGFATGACGGIGRRAGFRFQFLRAWEFKSPQAHKSPGQAVLYCLALGVFGLRVKMCVWLGVSRGLDLAFLNAD